MTALIYVKGPPPQWIARDAHVQVQDCLKSVIQRNRQLAALVDQARRASGARAAAAHADNMTRKPNERSLLHATDATRLLATVIMRAEGEATLSVILRGRLA